MRYADQLRDVQRSLWFMTTLLVLLMIVKILVDRRSEDCGSEPTQETEQ
jgi:hypothetical protein